MNDHRDRSTDALEADLRAFAHRAAPEPPPQLLDEVLRATQTLPQRARWSLASWPGLAAVAAIVVLAIAVGVGVGLPQHIALLISSPTAGPHASGSSVIPSSVTPAPDGSPSASASFELVSDPDLFPGGLSAVVAQPGLVVAGGQTCTADAQCAAAMWHSADGRSWDPPEALPGGADDGVGAIAVGAAGWVAIGSYHAWFSPDGTSWTQAEGDFTHGLADGGPSYQAEGGCCAAQLMAVAPVSGGFVAVGGVACFKCTGRAAVWTSSDGQSWNRLAYRSDFGASAMSSMTVLQSGRIVAVGGHSAWTSDDAGKTWSLYADAFADLASKVVTDGTRLTAMGGAIGLEDVGTIWTSDDGASWVAEARPELDRSEITTASELSDVIYIAAQYQTGIRTRETRLYRMRGDGALERIGVEPGAAGGAYDLIWSIAPLDTGLIAVGSTVTTAPNGQQPAGVWLLPSLPSPEPSIAPSAAPATVYRKWVAAPIPDPQQVFGGEAPEAVVEFKGAFFAVGGVNAGCCTGAFVPDSRAVVWRSADGRSWELEPDLPVFAHGQMSDVAANANRMVVVGGAEVESTQYPGEGEPHGAVWTSDDGVRWTIVSGTPTFTQVIAFQDRFLAVSPGQAGPSIWSSANGRSWHRVAGPTELGPGSIAVIRATSRGLVAVGLGDGSSTEAPPGSVIWVSGDGTDWQRIDATDTLRDLEVSDVTELRSSVLAVGQDDTTGFPVVLASANGRDWRRLSTPVLETQSILLSKVMGTAAGFVAFGSDAGTGGAVWVSSDGERWDRATGEEASFDGMVSDAIVSDDGLVVAVGAADSPNSHGVPRAWYSSP